MPAEHLFIVATAREFDRLCREHGLDRRRTHLVQREHALRGCRGAVYFAHADGAVGRDEWLRIWDGVQVRPDRFFVERDLSGYSVNQDGGEWGRG